MSLFEFLMILLSIIIGLGIAEILTGVGRVLQEGRRRELGLVPVSLCLLVFLALLQVFWESWSLRTREAWTFPALTMMLVSPICLHMMARLIFTPEGDESTLEDHYFKQHRTIWTLALIAIVVGTSYRGIAFGENLLKVDNLSTVPQMLMAGVLIVFNKPLLHRILLPLGAAAVALDTLFISYLIH